MESALIILCGERHGFHHDGCVFIQDKLTKGLRRGIYLFAVMNWISSVGYAMFPLMGVVNGGRFQDFMHIFAVTLPVVLLSIISLVLIMICGFRTPKYRSLAVLAAVAFALLLTGAIGVNLVPREYFGIPERFSVFAATGFNAILGIYLFNRFRFGEDTAPTRERVV